MTEKYRVHELARFNYSDIGEYIDENHTDRPLRNDILVDLLNEQDKTIKELKKENKALKMELKRLYGAEEDDDDYDLWIMKQVKRSGELE